MEQKNEPKGQCKKCGTDVEQLYCNQCLKELAVENSAIADREKEKPARPGQSKKKMIILGLILCACVCVIVMRMSKVIDALKVKQPLRQGTVATDAQTGKCIGNLWHIAKLLQEGKLPGNDLSCPASGKAYVISKVGEDTVARCPNPQLHGSGELSVSRLSPCPQVKK